MKPERTISGRVSASDSGTADSEAEGSDDALPSGSLAVQMDMSTAPLPVEEDPLNHTYFTGTAPKFGSTKCLILQLRDMASPYRGLPFRIIHCYAEYKGHPEACLLNERTQAVRVEAIDPETLSPKLASIKNLYRITFRHGAFEWRVVRTWKRKDVVNLLGMVGIPLLYRLKQRSRRNQQQQQQNQLLHHTSLMQHQQQKQHLQPKQQQEQHQHREYRQNLLCQQYQQFQIEQKMNIQQSKNNFQEQNFYVEHQLTESGLVNSARSSFISSEDNGCETSDEAALEDINAMMHRLETYEANHGDSILNSAILKFLGVSRLTFVNETGPSLWEGEVVAQIVRNNCPRRHFVRSASKAWMVIKDSHIVFLESVVGRVLDLVLVDREFKYHLNNECPAASCSAFCGDLRPRVELKLFNNELEATVIVNRIWSEPMQSGLKVLASNADYGGLEAAAAAAASPVIKASSIESIRSFAPPRESTPCKWLVDGAAYFYDLADALEQAKEEIFIADWFLSPEVLLRRPCAGYHELINILYRRATYNVQIFILLYSELKNLLNNHSKYTQKCLYDKLRKTKNIHIILHPRRSINTKKGFVDEYLFTHHEKIAVIDQKVAFFGGIDLCWGRWDLPEHPILDNGVSITEFDGNIPTLNPSFDPYRTPDIQTDLLHYLLNFFPDDEILEHAHLSAEMEQQLHHVSVVPIWRLSRQLGFLRRQLGGEAASAAQKEGLKQRMTVLASNPRLKKAEDRDGLPQKLPPKQAKEDAAKQSERRTKQTAASRDTFVTLASSKTLIDIARNAEVNGLGKSRPAVVAPRCVMKNVAAESHKSNESVKFYKKYSIFRDKPVGRWKTHFPPRQQQHQQQQHRCTPIIPARVSNSFRRHRNNNSKSVQRSSSQRTEETLTQLRLKLLRARHNSSQSPELSDAAFAGLDKGGQEARQRQSKLRASIWNLFKENKSADSFRVADDTEPAYKATRRWTKLFSAKNLQNERTNPWAWYGQLNTGYALKTDEAQKFQLFRGMDYVNWMLPVPAVMDKPYEEATNRNSPRTGWHDVGCVVRGQAARDVARHFIDRWNYSRNRCGNLEHPVLVPKTSTADVATQSAQKTQAFRSSQLFAQQQLSDAMASQDDIAADGKLVNLNNSEPSSELQQCRQLSVQFKDDTKNKETDEEDVARVGVVFCGDRAVTGDLGRSAQPRVKAKRWLAPPSSCQVQILRSLGFWSGGLSPTESSIRQAYEHVICRAQHYLYIENQFFISCCLPGGRFSNTSTTDGISVQNNLCWLLFRKIVEMHQKGHPFRLYLVLPALPLFTCEEVQSGVLSAPVLMVLHHEYSSLFRGGASLFDRLHELDIDPSRYVSVCSLRNWGRLPSGQLVTEQVYVHSKLIIADDRLCIIGSANINDRSLLGSCDSELAGLFEDMGSDLRPAMWQAGRVQVGRFAGSLRRYLMREHLGVTAAATSAAEAARVANKGKSELSSASSAKNVLDNDEASGLLLNDPTSDAVFNRAWIGTARRNRLIYEKVFRTYPNNATTFAQLSEFLKEPGLAQSDPAVALKELEKVRGHLVEHPTNFLKHEQLSKTYGGMLGAGLAKKVAPRLWNAIWM